VLGVLWSVDRPLEIAEITRHLNDVVAYTTVAKVLDRLHAKGAVTRTLAGRSFRYRPVAEESRFVAEQVRGLLDRSGDRGAVLQGLVDGLEPGDENRLIELLRESAGAQDRP
jgi:predicted transcriptional regulator